MWVIPRYHCSDVRKHLLKAASERLSRGMKNLVTATWKTVLARPASKRRTYLVSSLQIALLWALAGVVIWQNYRQSVDGWKTSSENVSLTVAAHASQTLRAADLVLSSLADWIHEEDIQDEQQFRKVMSERRFFEDIRERVIGVPQIGMAFIAAPNGDIVNSLSGWPAISANLAGREAFKRAVDPSSPRLTLSASAKGLHDGPWRFYLSRKLTTKSGEFLGIAGVGLDVEYFATFFPRLSTRSHSWLSPFPPPPPLFAPL